MNYTWLYDRYGSPVAYFLLSGEIYAVDGRPLAYMVGFYIYAYNGRLLGFFNNGWIIDKQGYFVLFTKNAYGGPVKPVCRVEPIVHVRYIAPIKGVRQIPPVFPVLRLGWSNYSAGLTFFLA